MKESTLIFANEMMSAINRMGLYCSWRDRMIVGNKESVFDLIITDKPHDTLTAVPISHGLTEKEFLIALGTLNGFITLLGK